MSTGRRARRGVRACLPGLIALGLAACTAPHPEPADPDQTLPHRTAGSLRIASYNVHFIRADRAQGPWSRADWEGRKHGLDAAFKALEADIVGFQELATIPEQQGAAQNLALDWLAVRNPGYGVAAAGSGPDFPSGQALFYRRDRLRLLDQGWFHCDDPTAGDEEDSRIDRLLRAREGWAYYCTWARFVTRAGQSFHVYNVHFHHNDHGRQRRAARAVRDRVAPMLERGDRVFVLGDTNALSGWRTVQILRRAGLTIPEAIGASFHFGSGTHLYGAIDRIAHSPGITQVGGPWLVDRQFEGCWPSDHYPIVADFQLPKI